MKITLGDLFMDTDTTANQHGTSAGSRVAKADDYLMEAFQAGQPKVKTADVVSERSLGDKEAENWVKRLLNEGTSPKDVESKLEKMASLNVFDRSIASEHLEDNAGLLGLAYIEPAHYMKDCVATHAKLAKTGGTKAASVKQIAACTGCQHYNRTALSKTCTLYRLPIVGSKPELVNIINQLAPGPNKKATLVALANRSPAIAQLSTSSSMVARSGSKGTLLGQSHNRDKTAQKKTASFTEIDVLNLHNSGKNIQDIFAAGAKLVGAAEATKSLKSFFASLKTSKTKIALTQIDCSLLKSKLSSSNAILGANKCASCTYRRDMHCGLTGGTLVSFPGMDKVKPRHRIASNAPKDGFSMVEEFDLLSRGEMSDIETPAEVVDDFELTGFAPMDL